MFQVKLLFICVLVCLATSSTISDNTEFKEEWNSHISSNLKLNWSFDSGSKTFTFALSYPEVKTKNIEQAVFLRSVQGSNLPFVEPFNPVLSTEGGVSTYTQQIPLKVVDSPKFSCSQRGYTDPTHTDLEIQRCRGLLTFIHSEDLKNEAYRRETSIFKAVSEKAQVQYNFELLIIYNKNTRIPVTVHTRRFDKA